MNFTTALQQRILVLDGAMGTMLQRLGSKSDESIAKVHQMYIDAGADIISTNTFTDNQKGCSQQNERMGQLARKVADAYTQRKIYVAASIGSTSHSLSVTQDASFDQLHDGYAEQIAALAPYVDVLLFETVFDTLNLKAGLMAAQRTAPHLPLMISATLEQSGRLLSGQTLDAFVTTVLPFKPLSIGLNCAFGASQMLPYLRKLHTLTDTYISVYPNAGLPNAEGKYDQSPPEMGQQIDTFLSEGLVNMVGGCCGTTPEHIAAFAKAASQAKPRIPITLDKHTRLTGLESLQLQGFTYVGERTNVAGSRKFARLIAEKNYEEALLIARKQVEGGAQIIDICMDDAMLDAQVEMQTFLKLISTEPHIAKVPIMLDSSRWEVLEAGLKCIQGKAIVNSLSFSDADFKTNAQKVQKYGAALIVMERTPEGCKQAYDWLTQEAGFAPQDIVFDPNVLAIGTGIEEHNNYALDFIATTRYIKKNLPHAKVTGGISNLSFAFRGNNALREAIHAVFLHHAITAGLDMGIVNPEMLEQYDSIAPELLTKVEALVCNTHPKATEQITAFAQNLVQRKASPMTQAQWRSQSVEQRLHYAILNGTTEFLAQDLDQALPKYNPLHIIEGLLMTAIQEVGVLFGEGKMFLPQVVKSAQVMRRATALLQPHLQAQSTSSTQKTKILLATVEGDVHDIGKNMVGTILECNGYQIIDLGVQIDAASIVHEAQAQNVAIVGLSGLITPSLNAMVQVAKAMQQANMQIPLMIGGATTSQTHTQSKIQPEYRGIVAHVKDASVAPKTVAQILQGNYTPENISTQPAPQIHRAKPNIDWSTVNLPQPKFTGIKTLENIPLADLIPRINWKQVHATWQVKGSAADDLQHEANALLQQYTSQIAARASVGIFKVDKRDDHILIHETPIHFTAKDQLSLLDFIAPQGDHIGTFVACVDAQSLLSEIKDEYTTMLLQTLCNALAESLSEHLFEHMQNEWWGFTKGIRPAIGYSSLPEHSLKRTIFDLLNAEAQLNIKLTSSYAMQPASSVCGFYFANDCARYF
ncbi:MAG: methionine synthase [Bacteroidales bacterium]